MISHQDLIHPRDEIMRTMERIYRYRMTTTSGGNLSVRESNGDVWITPARVDKGSLRREDIVCLHAGGKVEGPHKPSSEFPFHQAIYNARPDLKAVVHAHPVALVAFSICGKVPDTHVLPQVWRTCGKVGFAPYGLPGSQRLGNNVADVFAQGFNCAVLENHGVVVGGENLQTAFERFETLEFAAKTIIKATALGEVSYLSESRLQSLLVSNVSLATLPSAPVTSAEKELRRSLCSFARRAYQQRLMISTEGAFSARLDADSFLITPHQVDRSGLNIEDIVLVKNGAVRTGRKPSRVAGLHDKLYRKHREVRAIANAYPVNATAFCVTRAAFDARTIPESYIFLREVPRIALSAEDSSETEILSTVSPEQPVALLENNGALVCGTSILDAFDRLEVLESTAEAMINATGIGTLQPMSDAVIRELRAAFLQE